jgi:Zn-dependent protease
MSEVVSCGGCGNAVPARATVCPTCRALIHAERLKAIAAEAGRLSAEGSYAEAARAWRDALPLLPRHSTQYAAVVANIEAATARAPMQGPPPGSRWAKILAPFGAVGLAIWKLKFLLIGLTKFGTVLSALAFLGVYWRTWGWQFALAVVVMIYIHEMGHVAAMARFGMSAQAPMFIPGVGAFVRMHGAPVTPSEDAKIGLAGPLWGLGAALIAFAAATATHSPFWRAVANTAAVINLFNLTPVWQLDGSRGFNGFSTRQRWAAVALIAVALAFVHEGIIGLVGLVAVWRALQKDAPPRPDWNAFATYAFLLAALTAMIPLTARAG